MLIRIAVCDDEKNSLENIQNKIVTISQTMNVDSEIYLYDNGAEITELICNKKEKFDILFLDIDMPGISGLEAASQIREAKSDLILIFVSAHEQYVFDSIEYTPFRYIRKNKIEQELPLALKAAYACMEENKENFIMIKTEEEEVRIKRADIIYYETESRKIRIHMNNGKSYLVWKTIKDFYKEIDDKNFIRIHSGCVVNVKYIDEFSSYDITLDNGERLVVSRTRMKEVKSAILNYWGKKI